MEFFYTTDTPHEWSSGPTVHTLNADRGFKRIESLEEAEELARKAQKGEPGYSGHVRVAWGVKFEEVPD